MDRVLSRDEIRDIDRRAIEEYGIPSLLLMENAGRACADEAQRMLPSAPEPPPVMVLCGPGNNGGDGLVIARTLWNRGVPAEAAFVGPLDKLEKGSADLRANATLWLDLGREIFVIDGADALRVVEPRLKASALVVDALFGTGLARVLSDPWTAAVRAANDCGRPILAVDLPSGLDADTGAILGAAIRATTTVSLVARKPGFDRGAGPEHTGRVVVAEIGIPRFLLEGR